jgi:iron complex outermembrane receptor protein
MGSLKLLLAAPLLAPAFITPAMAQESSGATDDRSAIREIIVTAQRRAESLQRTPVAIDVLDEDTIRKTAIASEADLQFASPGLTVRAGFSSNQLNYALRGQSLDAFSDTRPGVVPYFNEVQTGGVGGGSTAFYDIQSIQVLKGPQGTLFGRNATGGAVLFTSTKPKEELGGYVKGSLGNYDLKQFDAALNVPIVEDKLLARLAGFFEQRDGYQRNLFQGQRFGKVDGSGNRIGDVDRFGLRGSITFKPSSTFTNELVVDYLHSDGSSLANLISSLEPSGLVPLIALTNFGNETQYNGIINAFTGGLAGCNQTTNNCAAQFAAANPALDPGGIASYLNAQDQRGPFRVEIDGPSYFKGRNVVVSNISELELNDTTRLRGIAGYTYLKNEIAGDIDGTPYPIDDNGNGGKNDTTEQYSFELQLLGEAMSDKLEYVVGAYYAHEKNENETTSRLFQFPPLNQTVIYNKLGTRKQYAAYAQGTYDLSDTVGVEGLGITLGARFTQEDLRFETLVGDTAFNAPPAVQATYDFNQTKSYSNVSWTVGLDYQVNPDLLLYVVSRRSYKNGGYNGIQPPIPGPGSQGGNEYAREALTDAEVGLKFSGSVGSVPTQLNLAAYQSWVKEGQRVAYTLIGPNPAALTVNVPRSKITGLEIDGQIKPTSWLSIGGSLNYTDARFTSNLVSIAGGAPVAFETYPDTPEWSGSVFGDVSVPVGQSLLVNFRGDLYAQSDFWFTSTGNRNSGANIDGYALVNLRAGVEDLDAGWSLAGYLKNAFDKRFYVGGIATGELFQFNTVVPGAPRTWMVEARYRF